MFQFIKISRLPLYLWVTILIAVAVAWSFNLVSFLDAKGVVLAAGLCAATVLQLFCGNVSGKGFGRLLPLWIGLAVWMMSGFLTARVLSFHVEKVVYLALVLLAASLASEVFGSAAGRTWLRRSLVLSGTVVGLLALLQYFALIDFLLPPFPGYNQRAYSVFGNQNLLGGYAAMSLVLLLPMIIRIGRSSRLRFVLYLATFVILLAALLVSGTRSAWIAAAAGILFNLVQGGISGRLKVAITRHWPRMMLVVTVLLLLLAAGMPFIYGRAVITLSEEDVGGNSRIWFWVGVKQMILEHPLFGIGLGNYAYWSPYYQGKALELDKFNRLYHNELHTVHAHSEPLEFIAETGGIGFVFILWFLVVALRRNRHETASLVALGVFACFNTISHSPPHLLAGLLLAAGGMPMRSEIALSFRNISRFLPVAGSMLIALAYLYTQFIPSVLLSRAEYVHIHGGIPEPYYIEALHWPWPNPQAHESYAIALMDESRFHAARVQLKYALDGLDTGRIHLLAAVCSDAVGDSGQALYHARKCLYRWPGNQDANALVLRYESAEF